jgi:hypothetical protein
MAQTIRDTIICLKKIDNNIFDIGDATTDMKVMTSLAMIMSCRH